MNSSFCLYSEGIILILMSLSANSESVFSGIYAAVLFYLGMDTIILFLRSVSCSPSILVHVSSAFSLKYKSNCFIFKYFIYERERDRQREKQAPFREPEVGLNPWSPGSHPGPKVALNRWATQAAPQKRFLKFIYLTERERELEHKQEELQAGGEGEAGSRWAGGLTWGSIPGPQDHDLSRR